MERDLQREILKTWGAHPRLRIARVNTGAAKLNGRLVRFGVPGTSDLCGLIAPSGRFLAIEVKSARGRQRRTQLTFERVIKRMGGLYVLARELGDVDRALAAEGVFR